MNDYCIYFTCKRHERYVHVHARLRSAAPRVRTAVPVVRPDDSRIMLLRPVPRAREPIGVGREGRRKKKAERTETKDKKKNNAVQSQITHAAPTDAVTYTRPRRGRDRSEKREGTPRLSCDSETVPSSVKPRVEYFHVFVRFYVLLITAIKQYCHDHVASTHNDHDLFTEARHIITRYRVSSILHDELGSCTHTCDYDR